jgi:hypothetical protein
MAQSAAAVALSVGLAIGEVPDHLRDTFLRLAQIEAYDHDRYEFYRAAIIDGHAEVMSSAATPAAAVTLRLVAPPSAAARSARRHAQTVSQPLALQR